jgi:TrmH family RNA methyltransferase
MRISSNDLQRISQLKTPNQALAIFKIPESRPIKNAGLILGLDAVQDPGNLGTIIRLCDWFGVDTLLCSKDTVDCYNPKVVQATMGSLSRVHLHYIDLTDFLKDYKGKVYGTFMQGASLYDTAFQENALLLMGNEANGISNNLETLIHEKVTIPQYGRQDTTESLNVATATAICLAEIKRTI